MRYSASHHLTLWSVVWCLIWRFASIEMSMVIHDTKCPYWDQVPGGVDQHKTPAQSLHCKANISGTWNLLSMIWRSWVRTPGRLHKFFCLSLQEPKKSYYKSSSVCLFVCLSVCLFVPYLLRGPLTDLRQTWWVYVGGPRNCPWGVLFRKGQRLDGSTGHFHFPLYYICASLTPHSCKRRLCCYCI